MALWKQRPRNIVWKTATAQDIFDAVISGKVQITTVHQQNSRYRRKHGESNPVIDEAVQMINIHRYRMRFATSIKDMLKPYQKQLSEGVGVDEIIKPAVDAWKEFLFSNGVGMMDDQIKILMIQFAMLKLDEMINE